MTPRRTDVPVADARAFVFSNEAHPPFRRARTLREFVATLEDGSTPALGGYLARGDFSRWIAEVFGDYALADDLERLEQRYRDAPDPEAIAEVRSWRRFGAVTT
jgi:hypothetical protein